ncbi:methyl-accepting chemotaxis sensory transducer [Rhodoferax ferrireducens T118]|uniref:Methyl-accepting chemotaxis sensory transducer n=1 Tax=Albidiferax ferrireducens (strain ATCC BAA-621 / DSM 15236 / T118) TaxID=338969 RepID=Q21SU6_ALBFT|nr:methyl-accepting chemotaxis protein [Rhodoferax ferrireducens]ABD71157.1 methyl-accepting chemotaxis sensory transducer [Rhodoferax ferrireducens T118]
MFASIRSRLIGISVLVVILAVVTATLVSYSLARGFLLEDIAANLAQTAKAEGKRIGLWAKMQKDIVTSMATQANAVDPNVGLQQAIDAGKLDLAYVGHADKRMISVPSRNRPADYDPTARPWYKLADSQGKAVLTAPYIGASSKKLVVSFAYPVKEGSNTVAVVATDVALEDVLKDLQQIKPTASGFAFIVDKDGKIIAHPRAELTLKPLAELSKDLTPDVISRALKEGAEPPRAQIDGNGFLLKGTPVPETDWTLVTAASESEALARLNQLLTYAALTIVAVGIAAALLSMGVVNHLLGGLVRIRDAMREIGSGSGDLTQRLPVQGRDEISEMAQAFNEFVQKTEQVMRDVRSSSASIANASREVAAGSLDLSNRTEQTASSLEETAASMQELTETVRHSADSANMANQLAGSASQIAHRGGEVVSQVVSTMNDISTSSARISDIIQVIDGIAFQTNILALNAAVEAARAGEQGRGFAVVASEVRSLAGRSAEAAKEIKSLIVNSVERVEAGISLVAAAGQTMNEIVQSIGKVSEIVGDISSQTSDQRHGIDEINAAIRQLDQMTQQNAALVEESTAAADSMSDQAQRLAQVVAAFKLSDTQNTPMSRPFRTEPVRIKAPSVLEHCGPLQL